MSSRKASASVTHPKMILLGRPGVARKHHCPEHGETMTPVKVWGRKGTMFTCKQGCQLGRGQTDLK